MQVVRENKLKCLSFLLALALLIAVVAVAASGGSSTAKRQLVTPREPDAVARTYALLAGIPQYGPVLGYRRAPVALQFFGDLQCIDSRRVMLGALPFLIRRYVRTGKLQIQFRSKETDTKEAGGWFEFREQQVAAMAAGKQDKLWNFISVFYRNQGPEFSRYVDDPFLERVAKQAGLDIDDWKKAREPPEKWVPRIEYDEAIANAARLRSTPSFVIGPTGGVARPLRHFALEEPAVFEEAIREVLST
ncbi:MAG TPA: thioredoxin domain-containing protein [Solirubrobacterales bacterium]|nr:thioredoxin domain-containing protein [Solirubrobacterales bacterium]